MPIVEEKSEILFSDVKSLISGLSVSGSTITYTTLNGSTGNLDIQEAVANYTEATMTVSGVVKLSDDVDSTLNIGVAATPRAVKTTYDLANEVNTNAVKLSGNQTIGGTKSFEESINRSFVEYSTPVTVLKTTSPISTSSVLTVLEPSPDSSTGQIVKLGAGGTTIVGAGTSSERYMSELKTDTNLDLYLTSDNNIFLCTSVENFESNRVSTFDSGGNFSTGQVSCDGVTFKFEDCATLTTAIQTSSPNLTQPIISFCEPTVYDDSYIHNVKFGGNGTTVIGAGTSSTECMSEVFEVKTKDLYLTADGNINFYTNANTYANKKVATLNTSGNLSLSGSLTASGNLTVSGSATVGGNQVATYQSNKLIFPNGTQFWIA